MGGWQPRLARLARLRIGSVNADDAVGISQSLEDPGCGRGRDREVLSYLGGAGPAFPEVALAVQHALPERVKNILVGVCFRSM